jgi:thioredoxin-like negative regulator of GroEL
VEKTIEIAPDNPFAFRALALGYVKQNRNEEAIDAMITAVKLQPNAPQLRQQLFDILSATGRSMEAEAVARGDFP